MTYRTLTIKVSRECGQWKTIDHLCLLSKHLYNASLYLMRQDFENGVFNPSPQHYNKLLIDSELYCSLPKNSSLQVVQQVHRNFCSFFKANKAFKEKPKKFNGKPQMPRYKHKTKGRNAVRFTSNQFKIKGMELHFPKKCNLETFKLPSQLEKVKYVEITPHCSHYSISVVYEVVQQKLKTDNGRYASIDLGVNNFATIATNIGESGCKPFLINGRTAKSVNHYYNKVRASLQSRLPQGKLHLQV